MGKQTGMDELLQTSNGTLRGAREAGVTRFLGVPYAAELDGEGWFLPARPATAWVGERDATGFGSTVPKPQYSAMTRQILREEPDFPGPDCLNLNVWTPDPSGAAPVFVWIHGGAFRNGSGRVPQYDGTAFARDGVVCVSINYRLGTFGFLDTGDEHTNIGLRDQIAALEWVRDNIAAFGGDPARVTIGGESAGGMSVGSLLSSPLAAGLFHRAIPQSGACHHAVAREDAQRVTAELAGRLRIEPTRAAFATVPHDRLIAAQNQLDMEVSVNPDRTRWGSIAANGMLLEPVIDGDVLPELPFDSVRSGAGAGVRLLVGNTAEEMRFFLAPPGILAHANPAAVAGMAALNGLTDPAAAAAYLDLCPTPADALVALVSDWFFRIPALRLAELRSDETFVYELTWKSTALDGILGSCHALELPFVFDTLSSAGTEGITGENPPQVLADAMHRAWVAFITDGDPGWPVYGVDRTVAVFDGGAKPTLESDPRGALRAVWEGVR
jgi:para-nitrobenzyl esterase